MTQPLEQSILDTWPTSSWSQTRILLAVSGGADSVALLRAMVNLAQRRDLIHVAHFNHQWRGHESDEDELFVQSLCQQWGLPLSSMRANDFDQHVHATQRTEQAARTVRYTYLTETAYRIGARYVVTAHTASDRIETLLHNLCRGTGLSGVASPTRFRNLDQDLVLARPLLKCTRSQVIDYLTEKAQEYRTDSSNLNTAYKRNFIRHKLLPLIESEYGDQAHRHLQNFSEIAEEAAQALRFYAEVWLSDFDHGQPTGNEFVCACAAIRNTPWPVVQMALELGWKRKGWPLQAMSRTHWLQIRDLALVDELSKNWQMKLNLPGDLKVSTKEGWLRIASGPIC